MATNELQAKLIPVIRSKKRRLEVVYNCNVCSIKSTQMYDFDYVDLNEGEVRKLQKALSKFIKLRDKLRASF